MATPSALSTLFSFMLETFSHQQSRMSVIVLTHMACFLLADPGRLTAQDHFGGFGENEDGEKSKADVMREVIAKSKFHKIERQKMKDADEELREQLDDELADIRGLLYEQQAVPTPAPAADPKAKAKLSVFPGPATGANATAVAGASISAVEGDEKPASSYDTFVRELAFERRAKPQDRLKSEEELAADEAQRLMKAEKARLKRMRGDSDDEGDDEDAETGGRRKRKKGASSTSGPKRAAQADDLDDDFELDGFTAGEVYGLGAGLAESGAVDESDDEEEDDDEDAENDSDEEDADGQSAAPGSTEEDEADDDDEDDFADLADADDAIQIGEDEESEQEGDHEAITGGTKAASSSKVGKASSSSSKAKSAPVTATKLPFTFPCPATHDELLNLLEKHEIEPKNIPTVIKRIRTLHHASLAEDNKYRLQALIGVLIDHALHWAGQAQAHQAATGEKHKLAFAIVNSLIPHIFSLSQSYPATAAEHFVGKLALMQRNLSRGLAKGPTDADARTWPGLAELTLLRPGLAKVRAAAEEYGIPTPDVDAAHSQHLRLEDDSAVEAAQQPVDLPSLITAKKQDADAHQRAELLSVALALTADFSRLYAGSTSYVELFTPLSVLISTSASTSGSTVGATLVRQLKMALSSRRFLRLQAHRAIAIASHVPKFDQQGYNPDRKSALDPDVERVQIQKMKALIKKERKGAIRELRRDNQFIAEVRRQEQADEDSSYKNKINKIMSTLQVERSEQKQLERAKANIKRRAGKNASGIGVERREGSVNWAGGGERTRRRQKRRAGRTKQLCWKSAPFLGYPGLHMPLSPIQRLLLHYHSDRCAGAPINHPTAAHFQHVGRNFLVAHAGTGTLGTVVLASLGHIDRTVAAAHDARH
ncbi:hypothetical protein L1887_47112 [Cichorium endivia]|nr:hypothetical protein L1887_47112 [Cichorium endivia]